MDNFDETKIQGWIIRYLEGSISDDDLLKLQEWLIESDEHFSSFTQIREYWQKSGIAERYRADQAWNKLNDRLGKTARTPRHRFLKITGYAAAITLLLGIGGYLYHFDQTSLSRQDHMTEIIEPGSPKAILVLSTNEKVVLGNILDDTLIGRSTVKNHTLLYEDTTETVITEEYNRLITPRGGEYSVVLSDGTKVWLNSESELKYPVHFSGNIRTVYLTGEAYFKVASKNGTPFVVCSGDTKIMVLGTEFNVRNYQDESLATTLVKGLVKVTDKHLNEKLLKPGQQSVSTQGGIEVTEVETILYTAWKDGFFVYHEKTLDDILKELARWYDFSYFYQNKNLEDIVVTAKLKKFDSADRIFEILEETGEYTFIRKGKVVTVVGK